MKILLTLFLLQFQLTSFAQESLVFENLELNENMRLIGMYPHYDKDKTYENYNFIIDDLKKLDSITKIVRKGKPVMNQSTRTEFSIRLFDGDKKVGTWSFNPKYNYIRIDGKSYEFDASQIMELSAEYGFTYSFSKKLYQTLEQYNEDYSKIKNDPNLLFIYKPNFKYPGTFDVSYPKTKKFKHPKAISEYLRKKIGKIRKENEFRVYYSANGYNLKNRNQYTMTIESDMEVFEWFKDKDGVKTDWKSNEYYATIFVKN